MTSATPHSRETSTVTPVTCVVDGGCSYLRALSTIERLAGFNQTASSYASAASRCQRLGCWAAENGEDADGHDAPTCAPPVPLDSVRPSRSCHAPAEHMGVVAPIPFVRSTMVDMVSDNDGNYVERRALRLETLPGRSDPLGYLYEYWCGLRAETECRFPNIDPVHLMRAGVIGRLHVVDVTSSDPEEFRFELFGYAIPMERPERPIAHPIAIYAERTLCDYNTVRMTAAPRLHRLRCRLHNVTHHYTRLILPFLSTQGRVERLLVAIRQEPGDGTEIKTCN
jgi:hypothetical protein